MSRLPCLAALVLIPLVGARPALAQLPKPGAAPTTITVAQRRAQLQGALDRLRALETRTGGGARNAVPIFKSLDANQIVRRADGATQSVKGNRWSAFAAGAKGAGNDTGLDVTALEKSEIKRLQRDIELEIGALERWSARPQYQSVDAGAIIAQLERSGQIRTGPTLWQARIAAFRKALSDAWDDFWKWLGGLFPTAAPRSGPAVGANFVAFVFWAMIIALLGLLVVLAYRAFAGNVRWGRRARKPGEDELAGEDQELLRLPPDELTERAAAFAREGNFREAVRHRYIALLLRLDSAGFWRYDARRTNWEHIAALRRQSNEGGVASPLADLTRRFDRVRYGGAACDAQSWGEFERDALALEARAGSASGSASGARELAGGAR